MTRENLKTAAGVIEWAKNAHLTMVQTPYMNGSFTVRLHAKADVDTAEYIATCVEWYEDMKSAGITTVDRETVRENERLREAFDKLMAVPHDTSIDERLLALDKAMRDRDEGAIELIRLQNAYAEGGES